MGRKQCRICRKPDNDDLISVKLVQEQVTIAEMILAIAGVSVTSDRRLPQNICLVCLERLKVAYELRQQCIGADILLRDELQATDDNFVTDKLTESMNNFGEPDGRNLSEKNAFVEILEMAEEQLDEEFSKHDMSTCDNNSTMSEYEEGLAKCIESDQMHLPVLWQEGVHYLSVEAQCFTCCGCSLTFNSEQEMKVHSVRFHRKAKYRSKFHPLQCTVCYETFHSRKYLAVHTTEAKARWKTTSTMFQCVCCFVLLLEKENLFGHLEQHRLYWKMQSPPSKGHENQINAGEEIREQTEHETNDVQVSSLQEIKIEIQSDPDNGDDRESQEEEYSIEIDFDEESSMDEGGNADNFEVDLEDLEESSTPVDKKETKFSIDVGQKSGLEKVMCRIPEDNLRVITEQEGYLIVELIKQRCCCCATFFSTADELEKHLLKKPPAVANTSSKYPCEYCGKPFDYSVLYMGHKRMREQRQFYMCCLCNRLLESEARMKSHMLLTEEHAAFFKLSREHITDRYESLALPGERCCFCWKYFDNHEEILEHFQMVHATELKRNNEQMSNLAHPCGVCNRYFNKQEQLEHHLRQVTNVLQYYCKLCDFQTRSARRIKLHLYSAIHRDVMPAILLKPLEKNVTKLGRLRYCCFPKCGQHFRDVGDLQKHAQESHMDKLNANKTHAMGLAGMLEGTYFECDVCAQLFKNATTLKNHQSLLIQQDCVCSICGIKKRSRAVLLAHERSHTGERPYGCDFCHKTFGSTTTLKSHLKCHNPRKYECDTCKEMFARLENLKRHIRLRHSEATYQCEVCPKKFKTRETLSGHLRTHTGEKPYKCRTESCNKWYVNVGDRRRHEMAVHTLERPHKCSFCSSAFIRKRQLIIHERRHKGDRPFVCAVCEKGFYEKAHLSKHSCRGSISVP